MQLIDSTAAAVSTSPSSGRVIVAGASSWLHRRGTRPPSARPAATAWPATSPSRRTTAACTSPTDRRRPRPRPDIWQSRGVRHLYRCPLRWADLDLLGHVNNVTYVDYLQEARVDMFRTHAPDSRAEDLAEGVVVVRHEVTYVSSLTFGFEPVSIECWVTEIRAASFTMAYEVFEEDEAGERTVFLRARTVLTPYVFATERPRRLHAEERESLGRLLEPDEPVRPPAAPQVVDVPGGHYPVHVRFSDVDVYGHVNNVKYFEYFQEARIQLMVAQRPRARPGLPPRRRADRRRLPAADPLPAPSPTTARPGSRTSAARRSCSSPSSATATTCWPARRWSACASTARPAGRRRCPRSSATWSGAVTPSS